MLKILFGWLSQMMKRSRVRLKKETLSQLTKSKTNKSQEVSEEEIKIFQESKVWRIYRDKLIQAVEENQEILYKESADYETPVDVIRHIAGTIFGLQESILMMDRLITEYKMKKEQEDEEEERG